VPEPLAPVHDAPAQASGRIKIADAVAAFLAIREGSKIAPSTLRKYRTFTKQLREYADSKGYVMLDQFTSADIDVFYANWKLGARAKGKALGTLRSFFRFCMNRELLVKNPVTGDLKPPLGANRVANNVPFTDAELDRIIDACDKLGTIAWSNGFNTGAWNGEDAKDFIWLLTYTGLRISDAGLFNMGRLHGNEVFLRAKKKRRGCVHMDSRLVDSASDAAGCSAWATSVPDWRIRPPGNRHGPVAQAHQQSVRIGRKV
jgi:site-specific recombinase XerD